MNRVVAILALCFLPLAAWAQEEGVVIDKIVARVDNYIVLKSEVERAYLDYLNQSQSFDVKDARCRVFENLVINKMMVAKAEIDSVEVTDEEVQSNLDRRFDMIVQSIGSEAEIERYYGKTIDQLKEDIRQDIREQLIVQRMQQTITADIDITPAEVKRFFEEIPKDSLPFFSKEIAVAQIVKYPEVSKEQKDKVKAKLLGFKADIEAGKATFEALAQEHSEDPGSAARGGNYGWVKRGTFVPEYEKTAFTLKKGQISDPVETEYGFHLIQLLDRRGNEYNTRHILLSTSPSASDLARASAYLDSLADMIRTDSISFSKAASEHSDDIQTSGTGGFFINTLGSNMIAADEIDPSVFFAIDTMQVGQISAPIEYRTQQGKEAVRILFYKSTLAAHQANLNDDYQKIRAAALQDKKNRTLSGWFDKARQEVYIKVDPEYDYCNIMN